MNENLPAFMVLHSTVNGGFRWPSPLLSALGIWVSVDTTSRCKPSIQWGSGFIPLESQRHVNVDAAQDARSIGKAKRRTL